jgi:hypothetical protein
VEALDFLHRLILLKESFEKWIFASSGEGVRGTYWVAFVRKRNFSHRIRERGRDRKYSRRAGESEKSWEK